MENIICNHCGSNEYELLLKPMTSRTSGATAHVGAYCKKCKKWIKWVSQEGLDLSKIKEIGGEDNG